MTGDLVTSVFTAMLILARVGSCLMVLPGFGSARVPMRIRLLFAVAFSLVLYSFISPTIGPQQQPALQLRVIFEEMLVGLSMGLLARFFMLGLQFAANLLTTVIGLAATPGAPIDDTEPLPPLVNLISMSATVMIFVTDLHYTLLQGLIQSYSVVTMDTSLDPAWVLSKIVDNLDHTAAMAVRLASPFIVYSIIVNLAIGFANKFTPQISIYFMTTGLVAAIGLLLFYVVAGDWLVLFMQEFAQLDW